LTDKCLAAIRRIAERDRLAREKRLAEIEAAGRVRNRHERTRKQTTQKKLIFLQL